MFLYLCFQTKSSTILGSDMGEDGGVAGDDYDPNGDPQADPRERRRIRYEYRELIAETQSKPFISKLMFLYFKLFNYPVCSSVKNSTISNWFCSREEA